MRVMARALRMGSVRVGEVKVIELTSFDGRKVGWSSWVRSRRMLCPLRSFQSLPNSGSRNSPASESYAGASMR